MVGFDWRVLHKAQRRVVQTCATWLCGLRARTRQDRYTLCHYLIEEDNILTISLKQIDNSFGQSIRRLAP